MKSYKLRYLPIFSEDLCEAATYLSEQLNNPQAAENLVNEVEKAILKRLEMPLSFEPFKSKKCRKDTYYRIYVVIDDVMEVRRFLYSARDFDRLI